MASNTTANPPMTGESRSARKKKAKAAEVASSTPDREQSGSWAGVDSDAKADGAVGRENAYIRELQKRIRNVNKKLTLMSKLDTILSENPGKSLDELVSSKAINADQKAQALKKPSLLAEMASLEETLAKAKEMDAQHHEALAKERDLLKTQHSKELEGLQEATEARVKLECEKAFKVHLLTFSRFLKAAAGRRSEGDDDLDLEGKGFEAVLSNVYTGDASAVEAIEKLINGSSEKARDWSGELDITYARIKELTLLEAPVEDEDPWGTKSEVPSEPPEATAGAVDDDDATPAYTSDSTTTNAGLAEMNDTTTIPSGASAQPVSPVAPPTGSIVENAGNAAAEEQWDTKPADEGRGMEDSYEIVPRPADDIETTESAAPAAPTSTQSWAEEAHAAVTNGAPASANGNDGFHEVHHRGPRQHRGFGPGDRGRGRGRGSFRGRGGDRGDSRGRGRGGRGGPPRGGRVD